MSKKTTPAKPKKKVAKPVEKVEETTEETRVEEKPEAKVEKTEDTQGIQIALGTPLVVDIDLLDPNPLNPRPISKPHVEELKQMITADPMATARHPIEVRAKGKGRYEITNGHHRWLAYKELDYPQVFIMVAEMDDRAAAMEVLVANRNRPLDMLTIGRHYALLAEAGLGLKQKDYASAIGKTPDYVSHAIKIAGVYTALSSSIKELVDERSAEGDGLSTHLLQVASVPQDHWESLVNTVIAKDLSVNETKESIARLSSTTDEVEKLKEETNAPSSIFESGGDTEEEKRPEKTAAEEEVGEVEKDTEAPESPDDILGWVEYLDSLVSSVAEVLVKLQKTERDEKVCQKLTSIAEKMAAAANEVAELAGNSQTKEE